MATGSCLCGKVTFEIDGALPEAGICHCAMCRKQTGHVFAFVTIERKKLTVGGEDFVKWYDSSDVSRRGFCRECGSALFFEFTASDRISVALGGITTPTGTHIGEHIYTEFKGDYYRIPDDEKQNLGE